MLNRLFGDRPADRLRLVVGLNQVDKIPPADWNVKLNLPSEEMERQIERRCGDIVAKLTAATGLGREQIEHYSATRRYRLMPLLASVVRHCRGGFRLDQVKPADPFELAEPEVREYAQKRRKEAGGGRASAGVADLVAELGKHLPADVAADVAGRVAKEREVPPRVAFLGKAGAGKTSTINALFAADWAVSHARVGTTKAQAKEFALASGGSLVAVDLPGYGRTIREDAVYEEIYQEVLPTCDLVVLILQADTRDFTDDQQMIARLAGWLKRDPAATT